MTVLTPVVVIVLLVLLNGMFVAAEFALIASRRSRLESSAEAGSDAARAMLRVFDHPRGKDRYIAVVQLGITLVSIGLGMYGEPRVAHWLDVPLTHLGVGETGVHTAAFVLALSVITFLHVVFGEMIPKTLALQQPERMSMQVQPWIRLFGWLVGPLVTLLSMLALGLMRLLRIPDPGKDASLYTSKELSIITEESAQSGQLNDVQHDLIRNIFALEDRSVEELMTSRAQLEAIDVNVSAEEIKARLAASSRSRYPVFESNLDQVLGVLHIKDFIRSQAQARAVPVAQLVHPLPHVLNSASADALLALFKREHVHAALVVDEFGGTVGFVTMDDVIQDVMEAEADPAWIQVNADGSLSVNGEVTLAELREDYHLNLVSEQAITIAGVVLAEVGSIPKVGASIHAQGYELIVEDVQGLKVMRVRIDRPAASKVSI